MKLVVIGGAGVRSPLLMPALSRRQRAIGLSEVVLVDPNESKLSVMGPLARHSAQLSGGGFTLSWTTDAREALRNAGAVITTLRVGEEEARVQDERIALDHGVLGQETTGPGGFAMALRSIPAVLEVARQMRELCPDAWLLNFTNPAGLVAQALTEQFPDAKIVGICDTPIGLHREVASLFGRRVSDVPIQFFGLNHLSWLSEALVDGRNVVPEITANSDCVSQMSSLQLFDWELIRLLGMLPNEYLYFYYYRERAVQNIRKAGQTRGEQIRALSAQLLSDLQRIDPERRPDEAWTRYQQYLQARHGTYMATETAGKAHADTSRESQASYEEGEGYAGVALDILTASAGKPARLVANVPSQGSIPGMRDDDVVEVVCECDANGLRPLPMTDIPEHALLLMRDVKLYERLTTQAIRERSRACAVEALMAHPLVGSYSLASSLVDAYLRVHEQYVGANWGA
jgi:6-phospho-beta-glucosidase